jgi:hypothetical protein
MERNDRAIRNQGDDDPPQSHPSDTPPMIHPPGKDDPTVPENVTNAERKRRLHIEEDQQRSKK